MTGWRFFHKTRADKATKFGVGAGESDRPVYGAPRPTRHLPTQCRPGWTCSERCGERVRLGRRHLLARPIPGAVRQQQSVVAQLLPSVFARVRPEIAFEQATDAMGSGANEFIVGMSDVRRVRIEDTGVVLLERTRCTQTSGGTRVVTLFWAMYVPAEQKLRLASICARGETELRTYRTQVADFLRRWTISASAATDSRGLILR